MKGLKAAGLKAAELAEVKGSDERKVQLADLLWRRTVVSQQWLAAKLKMKYAANVCQQMRRLDKEAALKRISESMRLFFERTDEPKPAP